MATQLRHLLPALAELAATRGPVALGRVGALACLSGSRVQRVFSELVGESPNRFQRRVRLDRAAALLAATDRPVGDVAAASGFGSHEAFTRAFGSRFGRSPSQYRLALAARGRSAAGPDSLRIATATSPCVSLYRQPLDGAPAPDPKEQAMSYEIDKRTVDATPVLFGARRVDRDEIATVLADVLPSVFAYVMDQGLPMAGPPYVRYVDQSPAFVSIEAGIPIAAPAPAPEGRDDISAGELPAGLVATTVHHGPYEQLGDGHAALDRWMAANGFTPNGPPWEVYLTDPGETPDPDDWRTEILWPIG